MADGELPLPPVEDRTVRFADEAGLCMALSHFPPGDSKSGKKSRRACALPEPVQLAHDRPRGGREPQGRHCGKSRARGVWGRTREIHVDHADLRGECRRHTPGSEPGSLPLHGLERPVRPQGPNGRRSAVACLRPAGRRDAPPREAAPSGLPARPRRTGDRPRAVPRSVPLPFS
jgi:hypothetical protein